LRRKGTRNFEQLRLTHNLGRSEMLGAQIFPLWQNRHISTYLPLEVLVAGLSSSSGGLCTQVQEIAAS
jgi:hypothetical protein